jgi:hypothetical protein
MWKRFLDWFFPARLAAKAEADELMEAYGNEAYSIARQLMREARGRGDHPAVRLYSRAKREIAKRTDFPIGLDTATRLLEEPVEKLVRPKEVTLH